MKKLLTLLLLLSFNANATEFYGCFSSKDYKEHIRLTHQAKYKRKVLERYIELFKFNPSNHKPEDFLEYFNINSFTENKCVNIKNIEQIKYKTLEESPWGNEKHIYVETYDGKVSFELFGTMED